MKSMTEEVRRHFNAIDERIKITGYQLTRNDLRKRAYIRALAQDVDTGKLSRSEAFQRYFAMEAQMDQAASAERAASAALYQAVQLMQPQPGQENAQVQRLRTCQRRMISRVHGAAPFLSAQRRARPFGRAACKLAGVMGDFLCR